MFSEGRSASGAVVVSFGGRDACLKIAVVRKAVSVVCWGEHWSYCGCESIGRIAAVRALVD